jgi:uncharacterized membrane protein
MMVVHVPMAYLTGAFFCDVAAAAGVAVPSMIGGYLLIAGLAMGVMAAAPGAVDSSRR